MSERSGALELFWYVGANPTVDIVLLRDDPVTRQRQVLLIQRAANAGAEAGKWALPGGFHSTTAQRGERWRPGVETERAACLRELQEETGLDIADLEPGLRDVGVYEGGGRDPRDTPQAWSRSTAFALLLPPAAASRRVAGSDDASDAKWFELDTLPPLAFDHAKILADGLARLSRPG